VGFLKLEILLDYSVRKSNYFILLIKNILKYMVSFFSLKGQIKLVSFQK